jgi:hypothetical protein
MSLSSPRMDYRQIHRSWRLLRNRFKFIAFLPLLVINQLKLSLNWRVTTDVLYSGGSSLNSQRTEKLSRGAGGLEYVATRENGSIKSMIRNPCAWKPSQDEKNEIGYSLGIWWFHHFLFHSPIDRHELTWNAASSTTDAVRWSSRRNVNKQEDIRM